MALTDERKLLLLGLLRQNDMHGYLLNAHLDGTVPISLKKPTAYNLLDRMERDGWIAHRNESTGDRLRKVYSVTDQGEQAFLELLQRHLRTFRPAEFPSAVALAFLDALPARDALEHLQHRRAQVEAYRAALHDRDDDATETPPVHDAAEGGAAHAAVTYALRFAELELEVLDEIMASLRTRTDEEGS
jgi:DNA-binding PadR family transcriptional regulator